MDLKKILINNENFLNNILFALEFYSNKNNYIDSDNKSPIMEDNGMIAKHTLDMIKEMDNQFEIPKEVNELLKKYNNENKK